ncbi:hypothetical protein BDV95DRAFT_508367 [Massariosphaeria phaeospora]|uniref:F-box domain-containing protein n=1 Tax=Massariosphaeria phaeospora TaxID=100035 RepID=A0A7C8I0Q8_9PLEO|nr:hypothetical protein BDV95DRAFT_508367 [Massariosphaeria phaeospora]
MKFLPDEIVLHIISYLEPPDLVKLQYVSRQFLSLARDNNVWKQLCFEHSIAERRRRRLQLSSDMDPRLAELIRAADSITGAFSTAGHNSSAPSVETQAENKVIKRRKALLANWDPTYPGEKVNFYQDFIQRHAPHSISWFQSAKHGHQDDNLHHEATGAGILFDDSGLADKLVAPLEDGSISIWDAAGSHERQGKMIARTSVGLLPNKGSDLDYGTRVRQSQAIMTETGAVECVSIDSRQKKGFFAVRNVLNEVDLSTLQVVSRTPYPFAITALSEARHPTPMTVGCNWTLHLHDTRKRNRPPQPSSPVHCELIGGAASPSTSFSRLQTGDFGGHVSLSQPGALSILHLPTTREWDGNGDIWVAGRFTSFLNFDRRFFPRLRGTVHSGARLSCLTSIPHPFISSSSSAPASALDAKSTPGHTLIAAGEYKGKGSLELYGLSPDPARSITSSDSRTTRNPLACYQNRQTASSSKLLSVAPHGTRLVFADGDGCLKWVERDGSTPVRQFNINDTPAPPPHAEAPHAETFAANSASPSPPRALALPSEDIVNKILPTISASSPSAAADDVPLGRDNLVIWTGDGRLGMVGFGIGRQGAFDGDAWEGRAEEEGEMRARERERLYGSEMRRALEMQARELRWLGGYGL